MDAQNEFQSMLKRQLDRANTILAADPKDRMARLVASNRAEALMDVQTDTKLTTKPMTACCDWQTFEDGFLATWRHKANNNAGEALVDWVKAKKDWKLSHCTGAEAAAMQLNELAREGEYLWIERLNKPTNT